MQADTASKRREWSTADRAPQMCQTVFMNRLCFFMLLLLLPTSLPAQESGWTFRPLPSPWELSAPPADGRARQILTIESSRRNTVTDTDRWFEQTSVQLPVVELDELPMDLPRHVEGVPLKRAIDQGKQGYFLFYGDHLLAAATRQGNFRYGFDFSQFLQPPAETDPYTDQSLVWAVESEGVLYVSNSHRTYAESSDGKNGYLTAVRIEDGELLWRSEPLVANSRNFLLQGDLLLSGYGFTNEPDYLYALDRDTGRVLQQFKVKTGPSYLLFDDAGQLQVRTYNTDYEMNFQPDNR